mmetsp:Transcript_5780/g.15668  ORF Transcript_5780/g.15668 Transcript_5780/m.15668 type:complete len:205 (+) Transcript_5780:462-1076(+)
MLPLASASLSSTSLADDRQIEMNRRLQTSQSALGCRRQRPDLIDDPERLIILDEGPVCVLRAPELGRSLVVVNEEIRSTGSACGPSHGALRHDGAVATAMLIPCGTIVLDVVQSGGATTQHIIGRNILVGQDALQDARLLGAVQVASVAGTALHESVDVIHGSCRKVRSQHEFEVSQFRGKDQDLFRVGPGFLRMPPVTRAELL